jgi:hypothetical protein
LLRADSRAARVNSDSGGGEQERRAQGAQKKLLGKRKRSKASHSKESEENYPFTTPFAILADRSPFGPEEAAELAAAPLSPPPPRSECRMLPRRCDDPGLSVFFSFHGGGGFQRNRAGLNCTYLECVRPGCCVQ